MLRLGGGILTALFIGKVMVAGGLRHPRALYRFYKMMSGIIGG
jgi:hypothetical protein